LGLAERAVGSGGEAAVGLRVSGAVGTGGEGAGCLAEVALGSGAVVQERLQSEARAPDH